MSRSALKLSAGEAAVVLQAADEALRAAAPILTKVTLTLLLEEAEACSSHDDEDDEATSSESKIFLNAVASMFSVAVHGPLSTAMALWGGPSWDDDKNANAKKLDHPDDQGRPREPGRGQGGAETAAVAGSSSRRHCESWMKKAKGIIESAGVACPDFAAEEVTAWSFDALGALWLSEAWLQKVVLPALRRRETSPDDEEPTAESSKEASPRPQTNGHNHNHSNGDEDATKGAPGGTRSGGITAAELEALVIEVMKLHQAACVPWDDLDTGAVRSGLGGLRGFLEALRPLDPEGIVAALAETPSPADPTPSELELKGEQMHRFFVQLAIMSAEDLLVREVKLTVARGQLPVPDALMSNAERQEEYAKQKAIEAAMDAADREFRDVHVSAPPPPVAMHNFPALLTYFTRLLEVRPGQIKATNAFRSLRRCLGRQEGADDDGKPGVLELCRDACGCFGGSRLEPLTASRAAELLGAIQKLLGAFEKTPRCAETADQLGLWSRKLDSVFRLDAVQVTVQKPEESVEP